LKVAGDTYLPLLGELTAIEPAALVRAYHDALETAVQRRATAITPAGWIYRRGDPSRTIPVDFAPLPEDAPEALQRTFAAEYSRYTAWLGPQAEVFRRCDRHAILVDVLEILRGGQGRYVERKASLQEIVQFYRMAHNRVHHDLCYTVPCTKGGTAYVTVSRSSHPYDRGVRLDERDRGRVYRPGTPL
jgi:predicted YcjX-like family ATPase